MNTIFIIGIFISLFQSVLLIRKESKSLSDKILAVWMIAICVHLISYYLHHQGYWIKYPHLVGLTAPLPLFYGPFLFLYVLYSLRKDNHLRRKDYWHFLPGLIAYLSMFPFYFLYSVEEKRMVVSGQLDDFSTFAYVVLISIVVSGIVYSIFAHRLLNKYKLMLNSNYSSKEGISLNWLKSFIWGVGLIILSVFINMIMIDFLGVKYPFKPDYIHYIMLVFAIILLGYYGIRHKNIFANNDIVHIEEKTKSTYLKSGLKPEMASEKYQNLLELMQQQKLYLKPKLTLSNLAKHLDISPNHLSQIINQYEKQNFNDFVNKYRIEEFIKIAIEKKHLSFLAIALESGFNSKSTFNTVFKKHKQTTPSKFMASLKN